MEEATLFDTTDIVLLAVIGLGTAAWFSRHQLKELFSKKKAVTNTASSNTAPKRETNFVKVMEQQVSPLLTSSLHVLMSHRDVESLFSMVHKQVQQKVTLLVLQRNVINVTVSTA